MNIKQISKKIIKIILIIFFIILILVSFILLMLYFDFSKDNYIIEEKGKIHEINSIIPKPWDKLYPNSWFKKILRLENNFKWIRTKEQVEKKYDKNFLQLYRWIQWWIYYYDTWLNIKEQWKIHLKVFYLWTNIQLSQSKIRKDSITEVDNTLWETIRFKSKNDFTIQEWDWWDYYWARFELRYTPKNSFTRKILEDYYIIEWWER